MNTLPIRLAFHQRNWEGVPRTFGNTGDPTSFAAMYQDLITNWNDSDFIYQPIPILKQFVREYVPQFSVNHIMNTYWDAEFLFDKLSGHSTYTVDENDPTKTVATVVIEPAAAFRHIQPMISTVETRPYCCRENKVEEIARKGYINIVTDEEHNQTIQEQSKRLWTKVADNGK